MLFPRAGRWYGPLRLFPLLLAVASCDMMMDTLESQAGLASEGEGERSLSIVVVTGNEQSGVVGEKLAQQVEVRVIDDRGRPRSNRLVKFRADEGMGRFSPTERRTDRDGRVRTSWTLGQDAGEQVAQAIVERDGGQAETVTLRAIARPGPARTVAAVSGNGQTGDAGKSLAQPLVVAVKDRYDNPVPGASVHWSAITGGGSFDPAISETDEEGRASTRWTLGPEGGEQVAAARVGELSPVTFSATGNRSIGGLSIEPGSVQIEALRDTVRLSARILDSNGTALPNVSVSWQSLDPSIATVGSNGLVEARANGTARIVATAGDLADTALVTVRQQGKRIEAEPASIRIQAIGATAQATAKVLDANGYEVAGATVNWSSSNSSVAQVDPMGKIVAKGVGTALVIASALCCASDTVDVTVEQAVANIVLTPTELNLAVKGEGKIDAVVRDASGATVDNAALTWQSSDVEVATVSNDGVVKAWKDGEADIIVSAGGKTARAHVTVGASSGGGSGGNDDDDDDGSSGGGNGGGSPAPVASVTITPSSTSLMVGDTYQLNVTLRDASGNVLTGRTVTWKSSATAVATVSATGLVMALSAGNTTITATSEGVSATAQVSVTSGSSGGSSGPWPNHEPSGFTRILHVKGDTKDWGSGFNYGSAWLDNNRTRIVSDPASKYGKAIEKRFFAGDGSGWHGYANQNNWSGTYRQVYFRAVFMYSPNWQHHAAAEKLWYFGTKESGGANNYGHVEVTSQGQLYIDADDNVTGVRIFRHQGPAPFKRGVYHTVEILLIANSSLNAYDGSARVWVDGRELTEWTCVGKGCDGFQGGQLRNIRWFMPGHSQISWDGVQSFLYWGGSGDTKTVNDWIRISEFYISAR